MITPRPKRSQSPHGLHERPRCGEAVGWNPSFFSVQYGEVGFIHWGERTTIYKNDSRDESASRNYESIVDSTWEIRVFIHSNLR
jgi:hypothetical protein